MTRKSKRELENLIDRLTDGRDYPILTLAELIAADGDIKPVDEERGIVRVDGQLMQDTISDVLLPRLEDVEGENDG